MQKTQKWSLEVSQKSGVLNWNCEFSKKRDITKNSYFLVWKLATVIKGRVMWVWTELHNFQEKPTSNRLSSVKFTSPKSYSESDMPFTCFSLDMSRSKWKTHVYVHSRPTERVYACFSFVTSKFCACSFVIICIRVICAQSLEEKRQKRYKSEVRLKHS